MGRRDPTEMIRKIYSGDSRMEAMAWTKRITFSCDGTVRWLLIRSATLELCWSIQKISSRNQHALRTGSRMPKPRTASSASWSLDHRKSSTRSTRSVRWVPAPSAAVHPEEATSAYHTPHLRQPRPLQHPLPDASKMGPTICAASSSSSSCQHRHLPREASPRSVTIQSRRPPQCHHPLHAPLRRPPRIERSIGEGTTAERVGMPFVRAARRIADPSRSGVG